jgi:hypothetical protein
MKYVNIYRSQHIILHSIWRFYLENVSTFHDEKLKKTMYVYVTMSSVRVTIVAVARR